MAPGDFNVQEADGTKVALDDYDSLTPYPAAPATQTALAPRPCSRRRQPRRPAGHQSGMRGGYQLSALAADPHSLSHGDLPAAKLQHQELSMNGDFRYTNANMNLPNYYDSYQGLNGTTRSLTYTANATAKREVIAADYGIVWQATKTFSLSDQVDFSSVHQPGTTTMTSVTTLSTPATAGNETINYQAR
jgi:hypothetical protein